MVERHFFGKKLLKTFDFDFGFVIPESENTCEHLYEFPRLSEADSESKKKEKGLSFLRFPIIRTGKS